MLGDFVGAAPWSRRQDHIADQLQPRVETAADATRDADDQNRRDHARWEVSVRIGGTTHPGPKILLDTRDPRSRDVIEAMAGQRYATPGDQGRWAALKAFARVLGRPMVPRHIHSEPTSRLAIWARRTAGSL